MEVLCFDLNLDRIKKYIPGELNAAATYLWVWHADKIPPHIGISVGGKYFSLKSNGKDVSVDFEQVEGLAIRKGIKTLLFELQPVDLEVIEFAFNKFDKTVPGKTTCLNPIKQALKYPSPRKLTELLAALDEDGKINDVYGINIDESFTGIADYDVDAIHDRLTKLSNG